MGHGYDKNLVLPIEINDGIWEFVEHKSLCPMQIAGIAFWKPYDHGETGEQYVAEMFSG